MAALLGKANGTSTLTIALDTDVPSDGFLAVLFAQVSTAGGDHSSAPTAATDTASSTWSVSTTLAAHKALIGLTRQDKLQVGSVGRACTAGDLTAGDTVTVTFSTVDPSNFHTAGLLVWFPGDFLAIGDDQGSPYDYSNGDTYPATAASADTLGWLSDLGSSSVPTPAAAALMFTAMGAYPAQAGFTPLHGSVVGELATGSCSIACAVASASSSSAIDPGGSWPSAATELAGNYQFVAAPSGFRAWQRF